MFEGILVAIILIVIVILLMVGGIAESLLPMGIYLIAMVIAVPIALWMDESKNRKKNAKKNSNVNNKNQHTMNHENQQNYGTPGFEGYIALGLGVIGLALLIVFFMSIGQMIDGFLSSLFLG